MMMMMMMMMCVCVYIYILFIIQPLNSIVVTNSQSFFCKCPCIFLVILSIVFYTLLQLKLSNKKHILKNAYIYTCTKFPHILLCSLV